jgi:hypothetical protein
LGTVIGLTFMFGFRQCAHPSPLTLRLGVPVWVVLSVAPEVDLSILGLLVGIQHLALHGATAAGEAAP